MGGASHTLLGAKRDSAAPTLVLSVGLHLAILAAAWWFGRDTGPQLDLGAKPIVAKLVRLGQKRDEHLLPRMEANVPPPAPAPVAIPAKPSPAVSAPEPVKKRALAAPVKPVRDIKRDLFAAFDKTKPVTRPDDPSGDPNGDPEGDSDSASEGERYFGLLSTRVKRNYDVSSAISDAERVRLLATVVIYIDRTGNVTRTELTQKSGNGLFDGAVMAAVRRASPFPPPPDALRDNLARVGVALKFRP